MRHAVFRILLLQCAQAQIARGEIKLLVKKRVIGNVHLPIRPQQRTVGIDDSRGVVVNAGGALFKQRGYDDRAIFLRELLKGLRARSGNGFRELEIFVVFGLAKILRAKQLLRADNFRALLRGAFGGGERFVQIRLWVR